ncbi:MAG: hypothetical protein ACOCV4_04340 [Myxococcota bacterium]
MTAWLCVLALATAGCGDDGPGAATTPEYVVGSLVTSPDTSNGYVHLLESLTPESGEVTLDDAYEFAGEADVWVYGDAIYVSGGETPKVTRFTVDTAGELQETGEVSFMNEGVESTAFWNNTFISETKAYMRSGVSEYVVWNPSTMEITGNVPLPDIEEREGFLVRAGLNDRASVLHDGKLYQPMYWSDESWADRPADSRIVVVDVTTDTLVDVLEAPCPGLDFGTEDDSGNLYFSNWTGGAGTHLVLDTAATCVVSVDSETLHVSKELGFADVADGREGAAFHHVTGDQFVMSVFHDERVDVEAAEEPFGIVGGPNWRLWSYDAGTGDATPIESVEWNSGAVYWFDVNGSEMGLIPAADYGSSTLYELNADGTDATKRFDVQGWGIRLFPLDGG